MLLHVTPFYSVLRRRPIAYEPRTLFLHNNIIGKYVTKSYSISHFHHIHGSCNGHKCSRYRADERCWEGRESRRLQFAKERNHQSARSHSKRRSVPFIGFSCTHRPLTAVPTGLLPSSVQFQFQNKIVSPTITIETPITLYYRKECINYWLHSPELRHLVQFIDELSMSCSRHGPSHIPQRPHRLLPVPKQRRPPPTYRRQPPSGRKIL